MQRITRYLLLLLLSASAAAQCGTHAPTPGVAHVGLSWVASVTPPAVASYNVYRSTTAGGEVYSGAPLANVTTVFYYDSTVTNGTTYYYTILAVGTGGVLSAPTPEVSALPVPPNAGTSPQTAAVP